MSSLKGHLLVASPSLFDPNFRRAVVLIGEHSNEGAMGVVLSRPSPVLVTDGVPPLSSLVAPSEVVFIGGPVQPQAIIVLGEFEEPARAGALFLENIGFLPASIEDAASLGPLPRLRVFAGYAGWAPGQLEDEIAESAWFVEPALPADVFTTAPDGLWSEVLRRKGGAFSVLATLPPDPSLN